MKDTLQEALDKAMELIKLLELYKDIAEQYILELEEKLGKYEKKSV